MGVLDDAIRQHLELKRKHGVPEDEVQRQEEEALGPARREVAQQPEGAEDAAADAADRALFDGEEPAPTSAAHGIAAETEHLPEEPDEHAAEAEPLAATPEPPAPDLHPPVAADPEPEPVAAAPEPTPVEPPPVEPPPHDSVVDDAPPEPLAPGQALDEDSEPGDDLFAEEDGELEDDDVLAADSDQEDLLEDTPDFLQETPEHDRLWFEQKPPRDFDFD
jgi:hypothetical protein